jgi:glycosyltransferase involved in cell wall biosynthesis
MPAGGFRVSVVTATRNRRERLMQCVESVAAQDHADKEHVVVDGASTDGTARYLAEAARRHPHLRFLSEPDDGPAQAMNKGLALATGDAIGVLGDDDTYLPGSLALVARTFAAEPGLGLVSGNCDFVDNDGALRFTQKASFTTRRDLIQCWRSWGTRIFLPAAATFFSRPAFDAAGPFDATRRYAMDYDHWIRLTEHFPVRTLDRTLARFRYDEGSISHAPTRHQWEETLAISRRYWGRPWEAGYWAMQASCLWYYRRHRIFLWLKGQ